jgi:threonine dehydratase
MKVRSRSLWIPTKHFRTYQNVILSEAKLQRSRRSRRGQAFNLGSLFSADESNSEMFRCRSTRQTPLEHIDCSHHGCLYSEPMMLEPVHPIQLAEIHAARERIAKTIIRTPLVRLELGPEFPDIRLKLENLQPINAYKLRGAANAVAMLSQADRERGVWTISAGNAGQGVAFAARAAGVPCTVVVVETAPKSKLERMKALGATLIPVPYEIAWKALDERSFPGVTGTFIHPFDDDAFIAGHGTMGLEILEDAPDVAAVIGSIGGGGLIVGVASAIKALRPEIKIFGVEPETAAPAALSFEKGSPQFFTNWKSSFVDGAGGQSMFPRMWERMKPVVDDYLVVTLEQTKSAMRLLAEKARIISEGAGALPVAAALSGKAGKGPVVAIVSGGNIDLQKFCELISQSDY